MAPNPNFFCPANHVDDLVKNNLDNDNKTEDNDNDEDLLLFQDEKYVWKLSDELAEIARKELGEDEQVRETSLRDLRRHIRSNSSRLVNCRTDSVFLLRFLRSQKFRFEKTCQVLENYLRMRTENPDWFANLDPAVPVVKEMNTSGLSLVLPGRDASGRRVFLSYASAVDLNRHTNADIMRSSMASIETLMEDEENQIRGIAYIFYCKGMSLSHCSIWTPTDAARLFGTCEKNLAVRHSDINLVRLPFTMWAVVEFVKQFLSSKIKGRIHSVSDEKKLVKKIGSAEVVPIELGGSKMTLEQMAGEWNRVLMDNRDRLLKFDEMSYNVSSSSSSDSKGGLWSYIPGM